MATQKIGFSQHQLRQGAVLATIAHAVWVAQHPLLAAAQGWDGDNYLLDDSSGTLGTVTFTDHSVVAVFFDANSQRNPFVSGHQYTIDRYVDGIPSNLLSLMKMEALQYMLQDYNGIDTPIITAAIWSDGNDLVAVETWENVLENGGHILRIQLMDDEKALAEWQNEFAFSVEQMNLVWSLYQRKMANSNTRFSLTTEEKYILAPKGGEFECRELMALIGIDF